MEDEFEIPVAFNNREMNFPARLLHYGYTYKIKVEVNGTTVLFERDEERNWRALIPYEDIEKNRAINKELLQAIGQSIEEILK